MGSQLIALLCVCVGVLVQTQNVFLTSSGIVKLGDFGIARRMDSSLDFAKTQIGTSHISVTSIQHCRTTWMALF